SPFALVPDEPGPPPPPPRKDNSLLFASLGGVVGCVGLGVYWLSSRPPTPVVPWDPAAAREAREQEEHLKEREAQREGAAAIAQQFVSRQLRAPGSAKFRCPSGKWTSCVEYLGENRFAVSGVVDSQNGFGALLRSEWTVSVEHAGGDNWRLISGPVFEERE
ncbi:MAG TPA: hypothetical protein VGK73_35795, partial [Polyangiaceae bacterium]